LRMKRIFANPVNLTLKRTLKACTVPPAGTTLRSQTMMKSEILGVLNQAQKLLWGGSETENIEAHNIIAELIVDLEGIDELDTNDLI